MVAGEGDFWQWEDGTRAGKGDGFLQARGQEGEGWEKRGWFEISPYGLRVCMSDEGGVPAGAGITEGEGWGWVPAFARTRERERG